MKKSKSKSFQLLRTSGINMTKRSGDPDVKKSGNRSSKKTESLLWIIWTNTSPVPQIKSIEKIQTPISETMAGKMRFLKIT